MKQIIQILKSAIVRIADWVHEVPYGKIMRDILNFIGDVMHRALFTVLLPKKYRQLTRQEIYDIIFKSDTPAGKKFDIWLLVLIVINIVVIMLESMAGATHWFAVAMRAIGWVFTILFTFEYYLRIYCMQRPRKYILSFYGIIDFLSIFPAYLSLLFPAVSTLSVLRLMRMLRIFRIFKMQRFLEEGRFLMTALKRSAAKILIFMMFVLIMAIILGATMYGIEGDKNPAISSIPRGVYWAVVTLTTVGYGDIAPVTGTGQFVSMLVMLLGYSIIAVPTGIVAGETYAEHRERTKSGKSRVKNESPNQDESEEKTAEDESRKEKPTAPPLRMPSTPIHSTPTHHSPDNDPGARVRPEDLM